jgi:hypothetical protein
MHLNPSVHHLTYNGLILDAQIVQLGTVNLCRSVIRSIETARNFDFEDFPVKDKVR